MMKKRLPLILFLCTVMYTAAAAKTIGFTCIYNPEAPERAAEITTALETELFEVCFDHGLIATSVEHTMKGLTQYKSNQLLIKLFDSSLDYLVAVYCEYNQQSAKKQDDPATGLEWKRLSWKIIDFSSQIVVYEENIEPDTIPETDTVQKAKSIGKAIGAQVLKTL